MQGGKQGGGGGEEKRKNPTISVPFIYKKAVKQKPLHHAFCLNINISVIN